MNNAQIQGNLHALNYSPGPLDGDPTGPLGKAATKRAQTGYGIEVDGDPGPITQGCLVGQLSAIQSILQEKGYYAGEIDGVWGPVTDAAIKDFQRDNGLKSDGIVDETTQNILFDIVAQVQEQPAISGNNYFGDDEFKCECGCGCDVCQELKDLANRVREMYGYPLVISSGFRCEYQNEKDGGIPTSNHKIGQAADMYSPGRMSYDEVDRLAECIIACGGGVIRYHDDLFCHMELTDANWSMN